MSCVIWIHLFCSGFRTQDRFAIKWEWKCDREYLIPNHRCHTGNDEHIVRKGTKSWFIFLWQKMCVYIYLKINSQRASRLWSHSKSLINKNMIYFRRYYTFFKSRPVHWLGTSLHNECSFSFQPQEVIVMPWAQHAQALLCILAFSETGWPGEFKRT